MTTKYKIIFSKQSFEDLDETFEYIALTLKAPNAAKNLMSKIEKEIDMLKNFPKSCKLCSDSALQSMNYRRLVVDNFVIVYFEDEKLQTVNIVRIFYGRRNWAKYLK